MFYTVSYMIAISKLGTVRLCHLQGRRLFSGGKFTEVCNSDFFFFHHKHLFFNQQCDEESIEQMGGQTLPHVDLQFFFPHISCQRRFCNITLWDISLY